MNKRLVVGIVISSMLSCVTPTKPIAQMTDAEMALSASRKLQASINSPRYYFLAESEYEKGKASLENKDFSDAVTAFERSRKFAELAELECLVKLRRGQDTSEDGEEEDDSDEEEE